MLHAKGRIVSLNVSILCHLVNSRLAPLALVGRHCALGRSLLVVHAALRLGLDVLEELVPCLL